jgi:hypothetical protein
MLCLKQMDVCFNQIVPDFEEILEREQQENISAQQDTNTINDTTNENTIEENTTEQAIENIQDENHDTMIQPKENNVQEEQQYVDDTEQYESVVTDDAVQDVTDDTEQQQQEEDDEEDWEAVSTGDFDDIQELVLEHGLGSLNYNITVTLSRSFQELKSADNEDLYTTLQENLTEIERTYEPMVNEWVRILGTVKIEGQEVNLICKFLIILGH